MGDNLAVKKNLSSIQVLKTLLLLLEGNYTMAELVEKLNKQEKSSIFNNSVISKYINTCRFLGIEIHKIHNKYYLVSLPFGLDLTDRDLQLFEQMQTIAQNSLSVMFNKRLTSFLARLNKYSNKRIYRLDFGSEGEFREKFEAAICERRYVKLMYKSREILEGVPINVVNNKGKFYFSIKHNGEEKQIAFERISGLEILDKRFLSNNTESAVVYKIKEGLAKRYSLRDNEKIIDEQDNYKVIYNIGEAKEALYMRLLRYDSLCEVLQPEICREDMKKIINDALANYGV